MTDEHAELHLGSHVAISRLVFFCHILFHPLTFFSWLGSYATTTLQNYLHIKPTRLAFLPLLISVVPYVILLSFPSPSPVANIHCVGIYPADNELPFTLRTPSLSSYPHPIFPPPTLHFAPFQDASSSTTPPSSVAF